MRHCLNIVIYLLQQLLHTLLLDCLAVTHCYQLPPRVVPLCEFLKHPDMHSPTLHFFHVEFGISPWFGCSYTVCSLPVLIGQCWQLLSCMRPVPVTQAGCLPMGCSGLVCGPLSSTIFLTSVSLKSLCEILEQWDCRRI
jgi:hypothetical protein